MPRTEIPAEKLSIKKLEKRLQKYLYPLIKKRDGPTCISCGKTGLKGTGHQAGHFVKAELCNLYYRYDPRNINSQCAQCNGFRAGNFIDYEKAMIEKYGQEVVTELKENYRNPLPVAANPRTILIEMIEKYKLVKEL